MSISLLDFRLDLLESSFKTRPKYHSMFKMKFQGQSCPEMVLLYILYVNYEPEKLP